MRQDSRAAAVIVVAIALHVVVALTSVASAASLGGIVRSEEGGESIAYARVALYPDTVGAHAPTAAVVTDPSGAFALNGIPPGRYRIRVEATGYRPFEREILLGDLPMRLDVSLVAAPFPLEAVTVRGDSARYDETRLAPGRVALTARRLAAAPSAGEPDLIRSLQLLPGVQAASDLSSGLYIRGGGPDQTLILLDQVPIYNPTHAFGFFSTFNADAIRDLTLYKGAYPAEYGGRLGSVLDVSDRDGSRRAFQGRGGLSVIAGRLTLEGPIREGSWLLSARRTYLDPILNAVRTDSNEIPAYYFYDLNGRVTRSFGGSDRVTLSGYRGRDRLRLDLDAGSYVQIAWGNVVGSARWTHRFRPGLSGDIQLAASSYRSDTEVRIFETPIRFRNRLLDLTAKGDLAWRAGDGHAVSAGIDAAAYRFELEQEFNEVAQPGFDERPTSVAAYVEDRWTPGALWIVRPGLRVERFGARARWSVEPRLSVTRVVTDALRLKAGGGRYTQHLQLVATEGFSGADFWVPTDASARPGRSWQAVAGAEWDVSDSVLCSVEGYYTALRDLVQLDNTRAVDAQGTTTQDYFFTGGRGWASGLEVLLRRRAGAVTGWIGYTLGWSRREWRELNGGSPFPPKYDRRHDLAVTAAWNRTKWRYGATFVFATGQAYTPAAARYVLTDPATGTLPRDGLLLPGPKNSARLLPYHRLDVSVTRHGSLFGMDADYTLQIFNLYDRRNEWFVQYDTESATTEPKVIHQLPIVPTIGVSFAF
ncbi:MAG: TonB-dependent receptor [Hyphomicrobiales bacterium]